MPYLWSDLCLLGSQSQALSSLRVNLSNAAHGFLSHSFSNGGLVDPRLRASDDMNDPAELARYLFRGGAC